MRKGQNTKLPDLLKSKKAKSRKFSELPKKKEKNRLAKLNGVLDEVRRGANVLSEHRKNQYNIHIEKADAICMK